MMHGNDSFFATTMYSSSTRGTYASTFFSDTGYLLAQVLAYVQSLVETVRPVASVQPGFHYSQVHYSQVRLYEGDACLTKR